ncbi:uncharacterized protein LOC111346074 [Stylophora pistillata]|uniref:uncharacterized protein LOC111346074 n=1 Tax=Stylophora pistillata TaxID=50429 RepID=UPI000C047652|nr:uncharacterized protein LOC111346074 [Stylophora pistillata]
MHIEKLKLFLHGLPPDCQGSTLKGFLEGVSGLSDVITKVSIPSEKTYAFVTVTSTEVVDVLLRTTLLYCDGNGQLYQIKACHYRKPQNKPKHQRDRLPDKYQGPLTGGANSQPAKYTPPQHVHQLTPDYSMLSITKPKRKKKKQDDSVVWFGCIGSTASKRKCKGKKKKKKSSKLELLKSESFQFSSPYPDSKSTNNDMESNSDAQAADQESLNQHESVPAMVLNPGKCSVTKRLRTFKLKIVIQKSSLSEQVKLKFETGFHEVVIEKRLND